MNQIDTLLRLPAAEAIHQLQSLEDPAPTIELLLQKDYHEEAPRTSALLLAANGLATLPVGARSDELLYQLVVLLSQGAQLPGTAEEQEMLRKALERIDQLQAVDPNRQVSVNTVSTLAHLLRVQAMLTVDSNAAYDLYTRALRYFEAIRNPDAIIYTYLEIGLLLWERNEHQGAAEYLIQAAEQLKIHEPQPPLSQFGAAVVQQLVSKLYALHYDFQEYEWSARLARRIVALEPEEKRIWRLLGNALVELEKFEGAADAYRQLLPLDPDDSFGARINLANVLLKLDREQEALRMAEASLQLQPDRVQTLLLRGQLLAKTQAPERAIADFERLIDLLEAEQPQDDGTPDGTRRYREHWTMWSAAYFHLLELYQQRGDQPQLEQTLNRLIATGDDALMAMGYRVSGDLARQSGDIEAAKQFYEQAMAAFPYDYQARGALARLLVQHGDAETAIQHLAHLADRSASPEEALEGLAELAIHFPDDIRIAKWRGFAQFELGEFLEAENQLDAYLAQRATDTEARRWLGLSLISAMPGQMEERLAGERCFRGLEELAMAAQANDEEAHTALLWVIDRLILKFGFDSFFLSTNEPILKAEPRFHQLLQHLKEAFDASGQRDYARQAQARRACIKLGAELGMPCFVAYQHALLADLELLQGRLQVAWEHIQRARQLEELVYQPRTAGLQAPDSVDPQLGDRAVEIEHMHIYGRAQEAINLVDMTFARIQGAVGNMEQAGEALSDTDQLLEHVNRIPPSEAAILAQTLRNAGRNQDALLVLDRAEQKLQEYPDERAKAELLVTRATILARHGQLQSALSDLAAAEPLLDESRKWVARINAASFAQAAGEFATALGLLDEIDIEQVARSDSDRFGYHLLRALSMWDSEAPQPALEAATTAIDLLDRMRQERKDLELRASWTVQQSKAYEIAIYSALSLHQFRAAFGWMEQSRARLLVDEMASSIPVDEQGQLLETQLRDATEKQNLLQRLLEADRPSPELLVRLRQLDPDFNAVMLDEHGLEAQAKQQFEKAVLRAATAVRVYREQLSAYRLNQAENLFGEIIDYDGCRNLCRQFGLGGLIECMVQPAGTFAMVVRSDWEEPLVIQLFEGDETDTWAATFLEALHRPSTGLDQLNALQGPMQPLVDAIEEAFAPDELLCIVPHGPLHAIPFQALQMSTGVLIERHPVIYAPSASVLAQLLGREDSDFGRKSIVIGDTKGDLPFAAHEARVIAQLLHTEPVAHHESTRRRILDRLDGAEQLSILHVACHGYFDPEDALKSGILTADEDGTTVLSARDFLDLHMPINLVVLSACESGISEVQRGDELMGLTRALLVGGTRSVLGSQWQVDDLSTSLLIQYFYEGWQQNGLSKVEALRRAQCRLMQLTREELTEHASATRFDPRGLALRERRPTLDQTDFRLPYYWAAFSLVGDWR